MHGFYSPRMRGRLISVAGGEDGLQMAANECLCVLAAGSAGPGASFANDLLFGVGSAYACPSSFLRLHAVSKGRRAQFTREEKILASV